ncbi:hypothetical protein NA57DRAFT_67549 [Rhizodiscina lignyota]|uniref:Ceramide glucosyltransferase n=1 Tax=Rhizodiscina lignyota TaxID=1504668 RepID=A0A9P4IAH1_9PEZI|nr:hypothetical protein NA57DRAFT_67549 [Rhizodiscina lignyota]
MIAEIAAALCCIWYPFIVLVCGIGYTQVWKHYSRLPPEAHCLQILNDDDTPHVTIIRPVKGLEPFLYECLAATFRQTYPKSKLTVYFCVSSRHDPAIPILEQLLQDFPGFDAELFIEDDDPYLYEFERNGKEFGPNPKIRNMSRAYREAKGDIMWIIDCNVWVGKGVAGRMVDMLYGFDGGRKNKFVHQLPLVVDTGSITDRSDTKMVSNGHPRDSFAAGQASQTWRWSILSLLAIGGGRLEELFMSSSHAKFYTAINTVLIAPCIVGKSNMFRRSHLNALTEGQGIDYFCHNICEDHLIGDLLWKREVPQSILEASQRECGPGTASTNERWGNHALVPYDPAIQPMEHLPVGEYIARRTRWLRVRKFTVALATLVEPGTESFLCSLYGAYAITTLPFFHHTAGIPSTWTAFWLFWITSVTTWAAVDWTLYQKLHAAQSIEVDNETPIFARNASGRAGGRPKRPFREWLLAWLGRETLAFPIWAWAVWGGTTVAWRGKRFWVGMDMRVHELPGQASGGRTANGSGDAKKRQD